MTPAPIAQHKDRPRKLIIFGAGGHGRELAWLAERAGWHTDHLTFAVDRAEFASGNVNGIPVRLLSDIAPDKEQTGYVIALGNPATREHCAMLCEQAGFGAVTLIHPEIELSRWLEIGRGSVIFSGTVLTTNIRLGRHVHINVACSVSHDVAIGDYSTLSPGVHISGHVHIGRRVFIGTGAVFINGTSREPLVIGDDAVIAAGACVVGPVEAGAMVAGVPAVRKR